MGRWIRIVMGMLGLLALAGLEFPGAPAAEAARAPARVVVRGTIDQVNAAAKTLTVKTAKGQTIPVKGTDRTVLLVVGIRQPTWNDLHVGDRVLVVGIRTDQGVEALRIGVRPPARSFRGSIASIEGNRLVIQTRTGKITLVTDERTRFQIPGVKQPTLKDLKVGDRVSVLAVGHWDDQWYATRITRTRAAR